MLVLFGCELRIVCRWRCQGTRTTTTSPSLVLQLWTCGWLQRIQTETTVRGIQHSLATSKGCEECQCQNFSEASVWLWIHESEVRALQSTDFVKRFMLEYESTYSVYRSSRNECLNDAKTRAPQQLCTYSSY